MSDGSAREETATPVDLADSSMHDIFSSIDNLIVATKEKSSASETDRRKFEHAWLEIASKAGIAEEVILRLYRGFTIDASMPFYLYVQKTKVQS